MKTENTIPEPLRTIAVSKIYILEYAEQSTRNAELRNESAKQLGMLQLLKRTMDTDDYLTLLSQAEKLAQYKFLYPHSSLESLYKTHLVSIVCS